MNSFALLACFSVLATLATQVHGSAAPVMTLSGTASTDSGFIVKFTILAYVEDGVVTGLVDSVNNTVTVIGGISPSTGPITSILAAVPGTYDNVVYPTFPYVSSLGFVFTDSSVPPYSYNLHDDGNGNLQLGSPYATMDTTIDKYYYAQFDGTSSSSPPLYPIGCFGDYVVGIPGHDNTTDNDNWTMGTYPQRAFPKAVVDDAMTVDMCGFIARAAGFGFFGVENHRECWFGYSDIAYVTRFGSASTCDLPCPGNSGEMCGGAAGAISIFALEG